MKNQNKPFVRCCCTYCNGPQPLFRDGCSLPLAPLMSLAHAFVQPTCCVCCSAERHALPSDRRRVAHKGSSNAVIVESGAQCVCVTEQAFSFVIPIGGEICLSMVHVRIFILGVSVFLWFYQKQTHLEFSWKKWVFSKIEPL